jgi:hypothetical protein
MGHKAGTVAFALKHLNLTHTGQQLRQALGVRKSGKYLLWAAALDKTSSNNFDHTGLLVCIRQNRAKKHTVYLLPTTCTVSIALLHTFVNLF